MTCSKDTGLGGGTKDEEDDEVSVDDNFVVSLFENPSSFPLEEVATEVVGKGGIGNGRSVGCCCA